MFPSQTPVRRFASMAIAAAVGLGLVVAPSASASATAAPPTKSVTAASTPVVIKAPAAKKSTMKVSTNKKSYVKGKKGTRLGVRVIVAGKAASGKVRIYDGKKRIRTLTLKKGKAIYTLPRSLAAKKHRIAVRFTPSNTKTVKKSSKALIIRVSSQSASIVKTAKKYVGTPYRSGGTTPKGFDCSGFTSYVYKKAGVKNLPRTTSGQRHVGKKISKKSAKPGDLIYSPGHVAIYLGGNKQIDAPRPGKGVQVRAIWQKNPTFIRI